MVAFARPIPPEKHHPAPWKAAKGGFGFDIQIELSVPDSLSLGKDFDARETIWWIAALLRLAQVPYLTVPVISDHPFDRDVVADVEPVIEPMEVLPRIFGPAKDASRVIPTNCLEWVKSKWIEGAKLQLAHPALAASLRAFDSATVRGKSSAALLALWGGIEQIFSPSAGELRFRVSAMLASYLHPPGQERFDQYKRILKLYNERSLAAHTANETDAGPLIESYVLMRNALVKMIDNNLFPTQQQLEEMLFGCRE
jgi:hypothetical protein